MYIFYAKLVRPGKVGNIYIHTCTYIHTNIYTQTHTHIHTYT